jgi:hypothetical protein
MPIDTIEQHYLVPEHLRGIQKDLSFAVTIESGEDADDWFVEAMDRLLKINDWNKLSNTIKLLFSLTDHHGKNVSRRAHRGDYIKILSKGNTSIADHEPHWILVEAIEYDDYPDNDKETIAIHLQPSIGPFQKNGYHHDNMEASGTFVIERQAKKLTASYHSRNDISETIAAAQDHEILSAIISWFSIPHQQWEDLIKNFIE